MDIFIILVLTSLIIYGIYAITKDIRLIIKHKNVNKDINNIEYMIDNDLIDKRIAFRRLEVVEDVLNKLK